MSERNNINLGRRREQKLAVALANSCRLERVRRSEETGHKGLGAVFVSVLLVGLGLLAVLGILREYLL